VHHGQSEIRAGENRVDATPLQSEPFLRHGQATKDCSGRNWSILAAFKDEADLQVTHDPQCRGNVGPAPRGGKGVMEAAAPLDWPALSQTCATYRRMPRRRGRGIGRSGQAFLYTLNVNGRLDDECRRAPRHHRRRYRPDWNAGPRRSFFIAGTPKAYRSTGSDIKLTCQSAFGNSLTVIEPGGKPARRTP
jgi:hypothetical protein